MRPGGREAVLAQVRHRGAHSRISEKGANAWLVPTRGTLRVLVEEVAPCPELELVYL